MAYTDYTELKKRFPASVVKSLTDDLHQGVYDPDFVNQAIADADSLIDLYIGGRYVTPVVTPPSIIEMYSCNITIKLLYERRMGSVLPEIIVERFNITMAALAEIRAGKLDITAALNTTVSPFASNKTADDRIFTTTELDKMYGL